MSRRHSAEKPGGGQFVWRGSSGFGNIKKIHAVFRKARIGQIADAAKKKQQGDYIDAGVFFAGHDYLIPAVYALEHRAERAVGGVSRA